MAQEEEKLYRLMLKRMVEAVAHLPPMQARRIQQHYLLGMSVKDIAQAEGVDPSSIYVSLRSGLKNLRKMDWRISEDEQTG